MSRDPHRLGAWTTLWAKNGRRWSLWVDVVFPVSAFDVHAYHLDVVLSGGRRGVSPRSLSIFRIFVLGLLEFSRDCPEVV